MTRFGYRFDLIRERTCPESKMKPRLRAEELTGMISLLRDKFVRSEKFEDVVVFVPMRRNSVFDGLRSSLFQVSSRRECH